MFRLSAISGFDDAKPLAKSINVDVDPAITSMALFLILLREFGNPAPIDPDIAETSVVSISSLGSTCAANSVPCILLSIGFTP